MVRLALARMILREHVASCGCNMCTRIHADVFYTYQQQFVGMVRECLQLMDFYYNADEAAAL